MDLTQASLVWHHPCPCGRGHVGAWYEEVFMGYSDVGKAQLLTPCDCSRLFHVINSGEGGLTLVRRTPSEAAPNRYEYSRSGFTRSR